ncbi:hypothetical protein COO60DRAFT_1460836 [Scenedesmus sp. NREL 46B-D3]|nr:hypothetical protein COO60DRAFT_1460836 [Scenedesmus sp. NREL 46B-D3]
MTNVWTFAAMVALACVMGLVRGQAQVSTLIRADITGSDVDCGQGGARCRICGDINAITSSCSSNAACVAFTFDGSCGFLKSATGPTAYREGYTTFVLTNKGATPPAAAAAAAPPASPAATVATPAATPPVQPQPEPCSFTSIHASNRTVAAARQLLCHGAPVTALQSCRQRRTLAAHSAAATVCVLVCCRPIQVSSDGSQDGQSVPLVRPGGAGFIGGGLPIGLGLVGRRLLRVLQQA